MNFLKNISISYKIIILSATLAAVFLGVSLSYVLIGMRAELIKSTLEVSENEVVSEKDRIEVSTAEVRNMLFAIRNTPAIQGIITAKKYSGVDSALGLEYEEWRDRLATIFITEMESQTRYNQLRYIDESGYEILRINFDNGDIYRVPNENLQDKSQRSYFRDTLSLNQEELYVSRVELNREGSLAIISDPPTAVIRYAILVVDELTGDKKGILIANVLFSNLVEESNFISHSSAETFIVNKEGYYLSHKEDKKKWGAPYDYNTGQNIFIDFPYIEQDLKTSSTGTVITKEDVFVYTKVFPGVRNESQEWFIVERVSPAIIFGPINTIIRNASLVGIGVFIILFFVFLFVVKGLLSPLQELVLGAEKIGSGNFDVNISVKTHDEVGRVAVAFNTMTGKLKSLYLSLEDKVKAKTKNLNSKVRELQEAQRIMADILKKIETEKKKMETILESIGDGVFVINREGEILLFNRVASHISGYLAGEAIGKHFSDVICFTDEKTGKKNDAFIEKAMVEKEIKKMPESTLLKTKDGRTLPVGDSAAPLLTKEGLVTGCVVVFRDMTKEYQIDKAKTEFVSLASHQLRTPLTSMNWNAEMLLEGDTGKLTDEQQEIVQEIYDGNQRMVTLVNSLLNVSRVDLGTFAVEPSPADIIKIAKGIVSELEPTIKEKILTVSEDYDKFPEIPIDTKLMRIVLQNLMSNAVKYTPPKGSVKLSVKNEKKNVHISVTDTGYGIPEHQQGKIFQKLFRADNVQTEDFEGTGLGLYLVKAIAQESGGRVWFESKENKGTTFHFTLPLSGMKSKVGTKGLS
jgi:PAS domain S-box-containing protein